MRLPDMWDRRPRHARGQGVSIHRNGNCPAILRSGRSKLALVMVRIRMARAPGVASAALWLGGFVLWLILARSLRRFWMPCAVNPFHDRLAVARTLNRSAGGKHAEIMLCVLKVIFGPHIITRRYRIARQGLIFFVYMRHGPPNFYVRAIAVEGAVGVCAAADAAAAVTRAAAAASMRLAPAPARAFGIILYRSHVPFISPCLCNICPPVNRRSPALGRLHRSPERVSLELRTISSDETITNNTAGAF